MTGVVLRKRARITGVPISVWYVLASVCFALLVLVLTSITYTNYVDRKREAAERTADRRWCSLLSTLDEANRASAPPTEIGRRVAHDVHELLMSLDCGQRG